MGFTGSGAGMENVRDGTAIPVYPVGGSSASLSLTPDCAFSDIFPEGDNIPASTFDDVTTLGVIPFVFAANNSAQLAGVTNLTRDQAILLMTGSGASPAYFFGGTNTNINNKVYLCGRTADSGTRITVFDDIDSSGLRINGSGPARLIPPAASPPVRACAAFSPRTATSSATSAFRITMLSTRRAPS